MALQFDQLVGALAGAVVEAQHQVRQAHISALSRYFEQDSLPPKEAPTENVPSTGKAPPTYSPTPVVLQIPRVSPTTGRAEPQTLRVPLITLVHPSQLSIKEMQITMQLDMSEIIAAARSEAQPKEPPEKVTAPAPYRWGPLEYKPVLAAASTSGKQPGQVGIAQVTLTVTAEQLPEGLSRLLDHLNKGL